MNFIKILQTPKIFVFSLINMILLVFLGTLSQEYIGLYQTQNLYFSSWIYFPLYIYQDNIPYLMTLIPLPGGRLTILVMFINLSSMLFKNTLWKIKKIGIIIVHCGALLLLIGAGLTAYFSYEGNMAIYEGSSSNYISDYYSKEFVVYTDSINFISFPQSQLSMNESLISGTHEYDILVISYFNNCIQVPRNSNDIDNCEGCHGTYKYFNYLSTTPEKDFELNNSAIIYKIAGINNEVDGIYATSYFDFLDNNINVIYHNNNAYKFILRPIKTELPFSIKLSDVVREFHPGTDTPKSFHSDVTLHDNQFTLNATIAMNEPLRYKGYTLYQSQFFPKKDDKVEKSVFAVVKNYGQLFPYISSIIMCIGLLIHLLMMLKTGMNKK